MRRDITDARCRQGWTGTVTPALSGYTFTPVSRSYSTVAADQTAQDYVASSSTATVWVNDAVPAGAHAGEATAAMAGPG